MNNLSVIKPITKGCAKSSNPYTVLGVSEDATHEQIAAAYRAQRSKYHPDRGGDPASFHKIKEAYELLSDPARRAAYDETGATDDNLSIRNDAAEMVRGYFAQWVETLCSKGERVLAFNPVEVIGENLEDGIEDVKGKIAELKSRLKMMEKAKGRVARKGALKTGVSDYYAIAVEQKRRECKKGMLNANRHLAVLRAAQGLLRKYKHTPPPET